MPVITLYHNPRCSKSRQALQLLEAHDATPNIILYLEAPLNKNQLTTLIKLLEIAPRELLRQSESAYKEQKINDKELTDQAIIQAMVDYPKLIERPIAVYGNKAIIGRPPEKVLELLK